MRAKKLCRSRILPQERRHSNVLKAKKRNKKKEFTSWQEIGDDYYAVAFLTFICIFTITRREWKGGEELGK